MNTRKNTSKTPASPKRSLSSEVNVGLKALTDSRTSGTKLKTQVLRAASPKEFKSGEVEQLRNRLHMSRAAFAACLKINPRTLEHWEQGRAKPNAQATLLLRLIIAYPDTIERVASI